jgi:hypothetical protein
LVLRVEVVVAAPVVVLAVPSEPYERCSSTLN